MIGLGTNMNSGFFLSRQYEHVFINTTHWLELKRICFCKNIECYYSKAFFFFFQKLLLLDYRFTLYYTLVYPYRSVNFSSDEIKQKSTTVFKID